MHFHMCNEFTVFWSVDTSCLTDKNNLLAYKLFRDAILNCIGKNEKSQKKKHLNLTLLVLKVESFSYTIFLL